MFWRREAAELNYRRFFAVTSLAGVRVELPGVFDESHAEILRWLREGLADGLRVDHPDGLARSRRIPGRGSPPRPTARTCWWRRSWSTARMLPAWWETDGTTGYDALAEIDRVLVDPDGRGGARRSLDAQLRGATRSSGADLIHETKRAIADTIQAAEVRRLVRLLPHPVDGAEDALAELLACFPVYRSYLPAGAEHLVAAAAKPSARRPDLAEAIAALVPLLADPRNEVARRFEQTTGPVMAKGVEDTAFYRYSRLGSLTEVGGDPSVFALSTARVPRGAHAARQASWPQSMTARPTHDTKRGEDVRARLARAQRGARDAGPTVLSELRAIASSGDGPFDALLWQAIIGSWPASPERLHAYAEKAAREAGRGDRMVGSRRCVRGAGPRPRRLRRSAGAAAVSTPSWPRSREPAGRTRSPRSCCSSPDPASRTSTRDRSSGRRRSSIPTTAGRSTSRCAPTARRARWRLAAGGRCVGGRQTAGDIAVPAAAPRSA